MVEKLGRKIIIGLFLFFTLVQAFPQEQNYFVVAGRLTTDGGKIDGATITILKNDSESERITPPRTGRFRFEFDYNNEYELTFEKEGFFKKIIIVSTHVPQEILERNNIFPPFQFVVNLFQELSGIDKSFTNKPVGRVYYNESIDNFDSEIFFTDIQIEEQIEEAVSQNDGLSKEQREIQRARELELADREKDYDKTIKEADASYQQQKLELALQKYEYAGSLFPERPYPKDRIAELKDLIAAMQLNEQRAQEQLAKYQNAINQADALFSNAEYDRAKQFYEQALELKPGDEYAIKRISETDQQLQQQQLDEQFNELIAEADRAYQSGNLQQARGQYVEAVVLRPGQEGYPQQQINRIDEELARQADLAKLELQYQEAIKEGDAAIARGEYNQALIAFRKAADLKENDSLANRKVAEVEEIILQLERKTNYDRHIEEADQALANNDFLKAKSLYQEALYHLPNETYPKEQIVKIDQQLARDDQFNMLMAQANEAFLAGNMQQAKLLFEQASQIKDEALIRERLDEISRILAEEELDRRYTAFIEKADEQFENQQFELSKTLYNQALEVKSTEQYPREQILKIDQELAKQADLAERERQYQAAMEDGRVSFGRGQYQDALQAYQRALTFKENDLPAQERIRETEAMILLQQTKQNYDEHIAQADEAFKAERWASSIALYQQASEILPDENYPREQINLINQIISNNEQFDQLVARAQEAFTSENYQQSKEYYQQALQVKDDVQVRDRIAEIDQILNQIEEERIREEERLRALAEERDKAYQEAMGRGNRLLGDEAFDEARTAFVEAKETKPEEFLPDEMIARVDSLKLAREQQIAEERAREEARQRALLEEKDANYNLAIQKGDSLVEVQQLELAKIQFETALLIKPDEEYPKNQIAEIEGRIAQLARLTASYNEAITEANRFVQQNQYELGLEKYKEALQYLPDEEYPKRQIIRLNEILERQEQERLLEQNYLATIQTADSLFNLNELEASKDNYLQATELKPDERYPRSKIQEIDAVFADLAREKAQQEVLQKAYQDAIQRADQAFSEKNYSLSKVNYNEALSLLVDETYPKEQLARIDQLIEQEKENSYQEAVARADRLFAEENFIDSKFAYSEALKIKANDQYATNQIRRIDQRLEQLVFERQAREELERSYQQRMQFAEAAFSNSQYSNSKTYYQEALNLKPEEILPARQIERIDSILIELQQQEEINQLYAQAIRGGQNTFNQNLLQESLVFFHQAAEYKPEESLPKQRIAEIEAMIAQQEEIARLAQMEEEQRLARLKARQEKYDAAIAGADQAFDNEQYGEARELYTQALDAKPDEQYPKNRIFEIDELIEEKAMAEIQRKQQAYQDSISKAQQEAYRIKIAQAEQFVDQKSFESAISAYQEAIQIWVEKSPEVNERIRLIQDQMRILQEQQANYDNAIKLADQYSETNDWENALVAYQDALNFKPDENYPKERIRFIQTTSQALEANYTDAIRQADQFFATEDWFNAKDKYTEALAIKKDESYPSQQLVIINQRIRENQEAQRALQQTEESYKESIAKGEQAFLNDQLTAARMHFEFAQELKPEESYPKEKIREIDDLIAKRQQEAELARQQRAIDDQYRQSISMADNLFKQERYQEAKNQYQNTLSIKADEDYPKSQIVLIDKILAEQENEIVSQVPIPETKVQEIVEPFVKSTTPTNTYRKPSASDYQKAIQLADEAYQRKDYAVAQFYYYKAIEHDADQPYPVSRVAEIAKLIDQSMKASELAAYRNAITRADAEFTKSNYSIARFYYYKGLEIKSWEQYPKERIEEIRFLTNTMLSQREEEAYRNLIAKADEAYYQKELAVSRSYYQQALGIKKDERYPKIKIEDIERLVQQEIRDQENQDYRNVVSEGDKAMLANNLSIARFYYNKALGMKPNEDYPKSQLSKIRQLLSASE